MLRCSCTSAPLSIYTLKRFIARSVSYRSSKEATAKDFVDTQIRQEYDAVIVGAGKPDNVRVY